VEIYQNCNIYNDGAFDLLKEPETRDAALIRLENGRPITFGAQSEFCVTPAAGGFGLEVRTTEAVAPEQIVVHNESVSEPAYAFALSRLSGSELTHTPIGIFRNIERPTYDNLVREQVTSARSTVDEPEVALASLLNSGDTWTIL
jgi:2-oxoglutarate ferredoxin oxidoreductase subunit beta